jgi:deoxyribodipyrimidine photo-lyase
MASTPSATPARRSPRPSTSGATSRRRCPGWASRSRPPSPCTPWTCRRSRRPPRRSHATPPPRRGCSPPAWEAWWGAGAEVEAFLDQLVTWRELGFNGCAYIDAYDQFESLPGWARATLEDHGGDPRPERYELDRLEAAETADPVWNAAQRELRASGLMHNYLRMLWGKRVLEWSRTPQEALAVLIHLNNKYALDGRDPNSYSGICWTFGRYDRPWFPERPIFGNVRYMSSAATLKKLKMKAYMATWGTP